MSSIVVIDILFTLTFVRIKARKSLLSNLLRSFSRKIRIVPLKPRQAIIFFKFLRLLMQRQMMDESARLLTLQQQLENEADGKVKYFGLSVSETIRTCILNGSKKAEKVKSDFKVADKRFVTDLI